MQDNQAMNAELPPPSEVLNRPFILNDTVEATPDQVSTEASESYWTHSFSVAGLGLLLPEATVGEVFDELPMCYIPNTNDWLYGIASQRGNVVPIFNLARVFGLDYTVELGKQKFFLIGQREKAVGMLIDDMPSRIFLDKKDRLNSLPPLPDILQPFVRACYQAEQQAEQQVWVDWDVDGLFLTVGQRI